MGDEDINTLFKKLEGEYTGFTKQNMGEKAVENIEEDYIGTYIKTAVEEDRENERKKIESKIQELNRKIKKYRNIKNHKMVEINRTRAKKRKEIQNEIKVLEMRLDEINREEMQG